MRERMEFMAFRCPSALRVKLEALAGEAGISREIRAAVAEYVERKSQPNAQEARS